MSVTAGDMKCYQAEHRPTNNTDPAGGDISVTEITSGTIGELLMNVSADPVGGSIKSYRYKSCYKNTHATDNLYSGKFYLPYSINDLGSSGKLKFRINDSTDATNTTIRTIGMDANGAIQTEDTAIAAATGWVQTAKTWKSGAGGIIEILVLTTTTGALKTLATVDVEIADSTPTELGRIPQGKWSAHANLYIWCEGTLNATLESANRVSDPSGASWTKPNTSSTGLVAAATIGADDFQGIWIKQILYPGTSNIADANGRIGGWGDDA